MKLPGSVDLCNAYNASGKGLIGFASFVNAYLLSPQNSPSRAAVYKGQIAV